MKLLVSQLHEGENKLQFDSLKDGWMKEVVLQIEKQGHALQTPLSVDLSLIKLEPDYYLKGSLDFTVQQICARCAEPFSLILAPKFEVAFAHVTSKRIRSNPQLTEESEEIDINFFEGNEIDLSPVVNEQFFLSLPYQAICGASCKGICQSCGRNLNSETCECRGSDVPTPFSVLKNYKL